VVLGLTKIQVTRDHVLPLAFPGIMTGSIIGLAQAMGETAPLIIVGMIAFIPDAPSSVTQAATVMPAQIFNSSWYYCFIKCFNFTKYTCNIFKKKIRS
jgi:ABC-type phosphate transport system permease subunit